MPRCPGYSVSLASGIWNEMVWRRIARVVEQQILLSCMLITAESRAMHMIPRLPSAETGHCQASKAAAVVFRFPAIEGAWRVGEVTDK